MPRANKAAHSTPQDDEAASDPHSELRTSASKLNDLLGRIEARLSSINERCATSIKIEKSRTTIIFDKYKGEWRLLVMSHDNGSTKPIRDEGRMQDKLDAINNIDRLIKSMAEDKAELIKQVKLASKRAEEWLDRPIEQP